MGNVLYFTALFALIAFSFCKGYQAMDRDMGYYFTEDGK